MEGNIELFEEPTEFVVQQAFEETKEKNVAAWLYRTFNEKNQELRVKVIKKRMRMPCIKTINLKKLHCQMTIILMSKIINKLKPLVTCYSRYRGFKHWIFHFPNMPNAKKMINYNILQSDLRAYRSIKILFSVLFASFND